MYTILYDIIYDIKVGLRNRLSSLDLTTSLIEVTSEYAVHFYDMYIEGHIGKRLMGDRIWILLLNLPLLVCDLIASKVVFGSKPGSARITTL